ncbi:hypothetical protein BIV19_04315 [Intestinimonas butyriciproducens]|nr:hypothetical protein BIV19_04315 [Intestinimonas butyriciproducens]
MEITPIVTPALCLFVMPVTYRQQVPVLQPQIPMLGQWLDVMHRQAARIISSWRHLSIAHPASVAIPLKDLCPLMHPLCGLTEPIYSLISVLPALWPHWAYIPSWMYPATIFAAPQHDILHIKIIVQESTPTR